MCDSEDQDEKAVNAAYRGSQAGGQGPGGRSREPGGWRVNESSTHPKTCGGHRSASARGLKTRWVKKGPSDWQWLRFWHFINQVTKCVWLLSHLLKREHVCSAADEWGADLVCMLF